MKKCLFFVVAMVALISIAQAQSSLRNIMLLNALSGGSSSSRTAAGTAASAGGLSGQNGLTSMMMLNGKYMLFIFFTKKKSNVLKFCQFEDKMTKY